MILGARVSTSDQSLDGQRDALEKAGAGRLFVDIITGTALNSTGSSTSFAPAT
jgi:hypothetical protein